MWPLDSTINVFLPEKKLRKQIMGIQTDSTPLEEPKDPDNCNVFELYKLIAPASSVQALREKYLAGGMGYGYAKQTLFELILERFEKERTQFEYYFQHPEEVHIALAKGAEKARKVAHEVLLRVRDKVGY